MFRNLVASSAGDPVWTTDSSTYSMIQRRELLPVSCYYSDATIAAMVGAIVTPFIDAAELIGMVCNGFVAEWFSSLASPVVQHRRQRYHAPPTFTCPHDPMGRIYEEKLIPPGEFLEGDGGMLQRLGAYRWMTTLNRG